MQDWKKLTGPVCQAFRKKGPLKDTIATSWHSSLSFCLYLSLSLLFSLLVKRPCWQANKKGHCIEPLWIWTRSVFPLLRFSDTYATILSYHHPFVSWVHWMSGPGWSGWRNTWQTIDHNHHVEYVASSATYQDYHWAGNHCTKISETISGVIFV